uniref:Multiple epidermal growth factor-like domains protein 11 n=1 Tax=Crassostrea virginica TaxID=6565 RepID=A0A8B8C7M7_CRAVI|nr:multiple epidermal growth factor-like domains protein 11 [Crassostrea virginica]
MDLIIDIIFLIGLVLTTAYDDLSQNKIATQSTTSTGPTDVYKAGNAVDRDITTCMRAQGIGLTTQYKSEWWKVDLGGVYNIYSINILFKNYQGYEMRQQGRFAGFSLYVSEDGLMDNSTRCYKDGPQLPNLNFTTTCITSGRYVIFYNERISGVNYPEKYQLENILTELCEVIVMGCQTTGVYGESCEKRCPTNCRDNTCHIQQGTCFGCSPGWKGTMCYTECTKGWYGLDCKLRCSGHCRDNAVCNHVTGDCNGGCAAGWKGTLCDKECEDGSYGYNCVHKCSSNCLHDSPCNKTNGHCEQDCKPGYSKPLCDKHCSTGFYGNSCKEPCSENCLNSLICDHIDGTCSGGCQAGFVGKQCNASCQDGYYGKNCSGVCPSHCRTCNPTDGTCGCYPGWTGSNCSIACTKSYGEDCQYQCSPSCINQTCDRFNGTCLTTCLKESHGDKCSTEILGEYTSQMSTIMPAALGGTLGACVILIIPAALILIRRKRLCMSDTTGSPYAEVEIRQIEDSTYQQLNVSGIGTGNTNQKQNISEFESIPTYEQLNVSAVKLDNTYQELNVSPLRSDNNYQHHNVSGLEFDNAYQNLAMQ